MNKKNKALLNMYDAVIAYCNNNSSIIDTLPAFHAALDSFGLIVDSIHSLSELESNFITGIGIDKLQSKKNLSDQASNLSVLIFAFACAANNKTLKEQVGFSPSGLKAMNDDGLTTACSNILDAANTNLAPLTDYGLGANLITNFEIAINDYKSKINPSRNTLTRRASYSKTLDNLYKQADMLLKNQMDKMILQLKKTNDDFYTTYTNHRKIDDPANPAM